VSAAAVPIAGSARRIGPVFAALMLVMLLASLDQTIVSTALPTIVGSLGGISKLSWVVTAYLLASTVATPIAGKLGDLYGRKIVLQAALVLFLVGSGLCGAAPGMTALILFRAIQGLGGGALMISTQAIIGDIVPPRERGRYSGLMGSVFGVSTVIGPLIGGFIVDHFSWRWIFYVNLPLGAVAFTVIALVLEVPGVRAHPRIDYLGMALLAGGLSAIVLFTSLGGATYPWGSPQIIGLAVLGIALLCAFVLAESRASEPVLPLRLFRNRVFSVASVVGFIIGFALFGAITYLPLFLQIVKGASPTASGLQLLPLMAGVIVASIGSGALITRSGRYKIFPIVGTALMALGLFLLSRLDVSTSILTADLYMIVLGLGLGLVMQVLILAVQNAVDYGDLGVATSGATLFRSMGGTIGVSIFGAIFTAQLTSNLADNFPQGIPGGQAIRPIPSLLDKLPPAIHGPYVAAYAEALQPVFLAAAGIAILAFVFTWFLRELPLRQTVGDQNVDEAFLADLFAAPRDETSLHELANKLSLLARRENRHWVYEALAERADTDLNPQQLWLLFRVRDEETATLPALAARVGEDRTRLEPEMRDLVARQLVRVEGADQGEEHIVFHTTPQSNAILERIDTVRREAMNEALAGWAPETHIELGTLVSRLTQDLAATAPA
jgi:EmrB/QacA subfamily drug resistance transporter